MLKKYSIGLLACFAIAVVALCSGSDLKHLSDNIRVSIIEKSSHPVTIKFDGPSTATALNSKKVLIWKKNFPRQCAIRPVPAGGFYINGVFVDTTEFEIFLEDGTKAVIKDKQWIKKLHVSRDGRGRISVVNVIPVEEYVQGVVEHEMPTSWPIEALKAQAVASRTFSVYRMLVGGAKPYDVKANFMAYAPSTGNEQTQKAVADTSGIVMIFKGRLFPSFFHAMCGGVTDYAGNNWMYPFRFPDNVEYCSFCSEHTGKVTWRATLDTVQIERKLKAAGFRVADIRGIYPHKVSAVSERVTEIRVESRLEPVFIRTNAFRNAMGFHKLKSNYFKIIKRGSKYVFIGLGRGHGAGMCQYGAKQMAQEGRNFEMILKYYYPGIEFRKIRW